MGSVLSTTAHADGCPVDHRNMSKEQIDAYMAEHHHHPPRQQQKSSSDANAMPPSQRTSHVQGGGCPVDHENMSKEQIAAFMHPSKRPPTAATNSTSSTLREDTCPVDHANMTPQQIAALTSHTSPSTKTNPLSSTAATSTAPMNTSDTTRSSMTTPHNDADVTVYDVYGQKLNTDNLMPATPNQLPSPGQQAPLSTDRQQSTIPKSGAESEDSTSDAVWTYPSPQMFYNALKRKGKADDVTEADMPTVVAVHNSMNEKTWEQVRQWERRFHCATCPRPKLKRFQGRPNDLSPVARFRMLFRGYPRPFDRHDWIVDRCGKEDARYVIDYYYTDGPDPIEIHVRPAVDSFTAAFDRMRAGFIFVRQALGLPLPPLPSPASPIASTPAAVVVGEVVSSPPTSTSTIPQHERETPQLPPAVVRGETLDDDEFAFLTALTPEKISAIAEDVQKHCTTAHAALASAAESAESADSPAIQQANVTLNYCMAQRICKRQAQSFMTALESGADPASSYGDMTSCLDRFQIMARRSILEAAGVKQSGPEFPQGGVPSVTELAKKERRAAEEDATPASTL